MTMITNNRKTKPATLYVLACPKTERIFYVGITCKPLQRRLSQHIGQRGVNWRKDKVLKSLASEGLRPEIVCVAEYEDRKEAAEAEIAYISWLRNEGCNLTNMSNGGEGAGMHTVESRQKISAASFSRKHSIESRQRISAAKKVAVEQVCPSSSAVLAVFESLESAARATGARMPNISKVLSGKRKTAGGFFWRKSGRKKELGE